MSRPASAQRTLRVLALAGLCFSCGPEQGERMQKEAFWDRGPPPIVRFRGEKVFWDGEWVNDGSATFFDKLGRVTGQGNFNLGQEDGLWTLEEDGFIGRGEFVEGQRNGEWVYKYPGGNVQEEGRYILGKREGEWRGNYSNGKLKTIRVYVDGKLKGQPETWDVDGHRN